MQAKRLFEVAYTLLAAAACAAIAIGVLLILSWGETHLWRQIGIHSRLVYGLTAPLVVVLFACLFEQATGFTERVGPPTA